MPQREQDSQVYYSNSNIAFNNKLKFTSLFMEDIEHVEEEEKPRLITQIILVMAVVVMVMVFFLGM